MLSRALLWLKAVSELGQLWLMSRRPHIEETLDSALEQGPWILIATQRPAQPGEPVYGTPSHRAIEPGQRYWIFVPEGDYWVYAVAAEDPREALSAFYKDPDAARLVDSAVPSIAGFRGEVAV